MKSMNLCETYSVTPASKELVLSGAAAVVEAQQVTLVAGGAFDFGVEEALEEFFFVIQNTVDNKPTQFFNPPSP